MLYKKVLASIVANKSKQVYEEAEVVGKTTIKFSINDEAKYFLRWRMVRVECLSYLERFPAANIVEVVVVQSQPEHRVSGIFFRHEKNRITTNAHNQ